MSSAPAVARPDAGRGDGPVAPRPASWRPRRDGRWAWRAVVGPVAALVVVPVGLVAVSILTPTREAWSLWRGT